MNYQSSKRRLIQLFLQNGFEHDLKNNKYHVHQHLLKHCSNGSKILVSYPGYKSKHKSGKTIFDYRVELERNGKTTALSHANIITDLYNKVSNGGMDSTALHRALLIVSREGHFDWNILQNFLNYQIVNPPALLLHRVGKVHVQLGKKYNLAGNIYDLTLEELFYSIKWIVLQEDVNYPIEEGFEGRRMPFARYLETLFILNTGQYSLEKVIERTLAHRRPDKWEGMDYSFEKLIF